MILYHGTTLEKGRQIIKDGSILCDRESNYVAYGELKGTTRGFAYLTKNLYTAYFYGNINTTGYCDEEKYVYIFKVDIPEDCIFLEPDLDELETKKIKYLSDITIEEALEKCGCVRVKKNINVKDAQYLALPATINPLESESDLALCRELSKLQINSDDFDNNNASKIIDEVFRRWKWNSI